MSVYLSIDCKFCYRRCERLFRPEVNGLAGVMQPDNCTRLTPLTCRTSIESNAIRL